MKKLYSLFSFQTSAKQCSASLLKNMLTSIFLLCSFMPSFGQGPCPPEGNTLTVNPDFPGCQRGGNNDAFKIVLVLDESGSIANSGSEGDVETAVRGFVSSLEGSASANGQLELAIVEFSSFAQVALNFTDVFNNGAGISTVIDNYLATGYSPAGGTNFTRPLTLVRDQLSEADNVFFITDGEPNNELQSSYRSVANQIKCAGTYMFCIGVDIEDNPQAIENLQQISGDVFFPATRLQDGANIALESFESLAECLSILADELVDDIPPTLSGCVDIQDVADPGASGTTVSFAPQAQDECGIASLVCVPASGSFFEVGTTTVTCTATDNAGLTSTCSFNVTILDSGVTPPPSSTCPSDCDGTNTFLGLKAGMNNTTGESNVFLGEGTGLSNTTGNFNTFVGRSAGRVNTTGSSNTYVGWDAGLFRTEGNHNTFVGSRAGFSDVLVQGERNTYLGSGAGATSGDGGSGNVFIGYNVGRDRGVSNKLFIDNSDVSDPLLYGDFQRDVVTVNGSLGVGIQNPERPIHLRASNAIFRIDRDRDDPGFAIVRYDEGFNNVWKSFYFYTRAQGRDNGKFVIADWGTNVSGPSTPRLIIDNSGNVGIGSRFERLANDATAKLHVDGTVRFQNLPSGSGQPLVVDANGNISRGNATSSRENLAEENQDLKAELAEIKKRLATLEAQLGNTPNTAPATVTRLYQNHPNPFGEETTIRFNLSEAVQSATLYIYDMQGTQIEKIDLNQRGEGGIKLQAGSLRAGMYLYSLVADGQEVDMKRMMITE